MREAETDAAAAALAYYAGDLTAIDEVAVAQEGHRDAARRLGRAARASQPGHPLTYAEFAAALGQPSAVRAAASICARNAPALFVPCHRVLRSDGSLGGFAWGLDVKREPARARSRLSSAARKVVASCERRGIGWRAVVAPRGHPSKEDAMNTIAVAVTPVAAVLRDPVGTPATPRLSRAASAWPPAYADLPRVPSPQASPPARRAFGDHLDPLHPARTIPQGS